MVGKDFAALLRQTFVEELEDHLRTLNRGLLELEKADGSGDVGELFRAAHSLKGAARAVDIQEVADVCHHMETLFHAVRRGEGALDAEAFDLLYQVADSIAEAGRVLRKGDGDLPEPLSESLTGLNASLEEAVSGYAPAGVDAGMAPQVETPKSPKSLEPKTSRAGARRPEAGASVRVNADKLDALLDLSGELLVARQRIKRRRADLLAIQERLRHWQRDWSAAEAAIRRHPDGRRSAEANRALDKSNHADLRALASSFDRLMADMRDDWRGLDRVAEPLEATARDIRMVPFEAACTGLERAVRDAAKISGKRAELVLDGGAIEVDRSVVEILRDPLMHMVRNAVAHGLEEPEKRAAVGKPATGSVSVDARVVGAQLEVTVADDGRGLDAEILRAKAEAMDIPVSPDDRGLFRLLFEPGFTTAAEVTTVSGRGVGLDVVKTSLQAARGSVDISSEPGQGTRFVLRLPLTLTRLRALLLIAGGQTLALDIGVVRRTLRVGSEDLATVEGRDTLSIDGKAIPVVALADAIGLEGFKTRRADDGAPAKPLPAVYLALGPDEVVVTADHLLAEDEIVVKDIGDRLAQGYGISGASILATGEVALILNAADLIESALGRTPVLRPSVRPTETEDLGPSRVIVCDDSVTVRTLEVGILESAGYEVLAAADGAEAWRLLQDRGADLVVSDIDMPRMDGFELTEAIRASTRFGALPIILVTSLSTDAHRRQGMKVGADAYLVKSSFDEGALLETVEQLIGRTP